MKKIIAVVFLGLTFFSACGGGSGAGGLLGYFSNIDLYRVCDTHLENRHDELLMEYGGEKVYLWTIDEENNYLEAYYEYALNVGTDRVWITDDYGETDECLVIKKTDSTQFDCIERGLSEWYHTLQAAKENIGSCNAF